MEAKDEEAPSKLAKVEITSSQLVGGVVPGSVGIGFPPQSALDIVQPIYNPALAMPPSGWPVPPRPQPWFPQHPAVLNPPPVPMGLVQQPLFPVQNVQPPLPSNTSPALQPSLPIAPPGLPSSTPSVPVSQPLFPIGTNNSIPTHTSPFSVPMLSRSIPLSSPVEFRSPINSHSSSSTSMASSYLAPNMQVSSKRVLLERVASPSYRQEYPKPYSRQGYNSDYSPNVPCETSYTHTGSDLCDELKRWPLRSTLKA
ncbi:hypothetical protein L1049_010232 [Liquidambar formosana]|uniref:Uncharacterized protein n=1 Tax=Liquidambar formosana TaxID=63359 RepID=A0AAP0R6W1_LIQFO